MTLLHKNDKYLGDSVYVSNEHSDIVLYTYNGVGKPSNIIYLDKDIQDALVDYICELGTKS